MPSKVIAIPATLGRRWSRVKANRTGKTALAASGTKLVGGVTPGRGGEQHLGLTSVGGGHQHSGQGYETGQTNWTDALIHPVQLVHAQTSEHEHAGRENGASGDHEEQGQRDQRHRDEGARAHV